MKIGYACVPLTIQYRTNRRFSLKNFTKEKFITVTGENIKDLLEILKSNKKKDIYLFRISSDLIPFGSHNINNIMWWDVFKDEFIEIGEYIKDNLMRVSMHPGQYTVLNSMNEDTVKRAIADLEYHTRILDAMELDYSHKIVIHVGGVYGDKAVATNNFKQNFKRLSDSAKKRLILENDDKSYNIEDVLNICNDLSIPAVFDIFHHECYPSLGNIEDILKQVKKTWKEEDGDIKLHYSNADNEKRLGAHSKFIDSKQFICFYEKVKKYNPDIMLEVKDKDISAIKCGNIIKKLENRSSFKEKNSLTKEWARYKYLVMEKDYSLYKKASNLVKEEVSIEEFYEFIDKVCMLPFNKGNFINTAEHVYGYFKNDISLREKENLFKLIKNAEDYTKVKEKLKKLSVKYNESYLLDSYYFRDI
ncbi:MAG: UV DNA damage repair endonuclease UvsE [Clostridiaceae bacterium]